MACPTLAARQLRALLSKATCTPLPGAYNGLCGRAVADAGFDACYVSGAAVSAAAGVPDVGVLSLAAFTRAIAEVSAASGLPVFADADTGFTHEGNCPSQTVAAYAHAGAAGLHFEDQVFPKRCGHLDGKELVPAAAFADTIAHCVATRNALPEHLGGGQHGTVICARTDARGTSIGLRGAIDRCRLYTDAGADMIFPEGLTSEEEFAEVAAALRAHPRRPFLVANMTEFGRTPHIPLSSFQALGYDAVIYPVSTLRAASAAIAGTLAELQASGCLAGAVARGEFQTREELYSLLQYDPRSTTAWSFPTPSRPLQAGGVVPSFGAAPTAFVTAASTATARGVQVVGIPASLMRGGSSKGLFFNTQLVPPALLQPGHVRDGVCSAAVGSPDPYGQQMDGVGSATSSTSKVVFVGPSSQPGCDVDYTFGHVSIKGSDEGRPVVDWGGNCGNLSAAVGPFAVEEGLVPLSKDNAIVDPVSDEVTHVIVRVWQTNTQTRMACHVPVVAGIRLPPVSDAAPGGVTTVPSSSVRVLGDYEVPGVNGKAARVVVEFVEPTAHALPTGQPLDVLTIPHRDHARDANPSGVETERVEATMVNAGNPVVFVRAQDVGLSGVESQLDTTSRAAAVLEQIRCQAALAMGVVAPGTPAATITETSPAVPKVAIVAPPVSYTTPAGAHVDGSSIDLVARMMSMGLFHHAFPGTASVALAVAAAIPGTVVNTAAQSHDRDACDSQSPGTPSTLRFGHRSGCVEVDAVTRVHVEEGSQDRHHHVAVTSVSMGRSARTLMRGTVFVPHHAFV